MMSYLDDAYFFSQCDRCTFNTHNPHLLCAVHPFKIVDARCPDFELNTSLPAVELWEPEGASYYAGELVIDPTQRWTREQKIALLDWHPLFTGRCPDCEQAILQTHPAQLHWDCEHCVWKDDSL